LRSAIIIILLLLLLLIIEYPTIFLPLIVSIGGILFIIIKRTSNKIAREEQAISQSIEESSNIYKKIKSEIDIPIETRIVYYKDGDVGILKGSLQLWLKDGVLHFFPFIPVINKPIDIRNKVYLLKINVRDIEYFSREESRGRDTILKYSHKGQDYLMIFSNKDYRIFKEIIPDKDFDFSQEEDKVVKLVSNDR